MSFIIEIDRNFTIASIVFLVTVVILTQLSLRHVSKTVMSVPRVPMLDIYHAHIPEWVTDYYEYTDWFPFIPILLFVLLDKFEHATEMVFLLGIMYLLRVIAFSLTLFPSPNQNCKEEWEHEPETFLRGILNFLWQEGCGDLMFSGHTTCMVMGTLFLCKYCFSGNTLAHGCLLIFNIIGAIAIIGTRMHYSVDVFIASIVSILLFFSFHK